MNAVEHLEHALAGRPRSPLHRPAIGPDVELLTGPGSLVAGTSDLHRMATKGPVFAALPSAVARERGLDVWQDDTPLVAMQVEHRVTLTSNELHDVTGGMTLPVAEGAFEDDDARYADRVGRLVSEEINRGAGANFVVERRWVGTLSEVEPRSMAALFAELLASERGAYWTFLFWTGRASSSGPRPSVT